MTNFKWNVTEKILVWIWGFLTGFRFPRPYRFGRCTIMADIFPHHYNELVVLNCLIQVALAKKITLSTFWHRKWPRWVETDRYFRQTEKNYVKQGMCKICGLSGYFIVRPRRRHMRLWCSINSVLVRASIRNNMIYHSGPWTSWLKQAVK